MSLSGVSSSDSAVAMHKLKDICQSVTGELHNLIGSGAQYRFGVCFKLASDHIGDSVVGCLDREISENLLQAELAQLRSVGRMSASLLDIMQKSGQVAADRDAISKELSRTVSENQALTLEVSDLKTELDHLKTHSSSRDASSRDAEVIDLTSQLSDAALERADLVASHTDEKHNLNVAKNAAIHDMASHLISYISGALPSDVLIGSMQSKFGIIN